jgi:hypothetical protein
MNTEDAWKTVVQNCRELFLRKNQDYGLSWTIMRTSSLTDQILIKAKRLRTIEERGVHQVEDPVEDEYMGMVNYCLMAILTLEDPTPVTADNVLTRFDLAADLCFRTMQAKNHDYGEACRDLRVSSITDLILAKLLRLRQMEEQGGKLLVSEGPVANYVDIVNYSIFALILLGKV